MPQRRLSGFIPTTMDFKRKGLTVLGVRLLTDSYAGQWDIDGCGYGIGAYGAADSRNRFVVQSRGSGRSGP